MKMFRNGQPIVRPPVAGAVTERIERPRRALAAIGLAAFAMVLSSVALSADQKGAEIETARAAIAKWVETRRIISQEQRDWALGRELLIDRIELIRREINSLQGKVSEAQATITEADTKRSVLMGENDQLKEAASALATIVKSLETRTSQLLERVPDPLRERVKPLSQRLPGHGDESALPLAVRFQNIIGILNEVNKFNREITLTSEVRTLPDGASAEVTAMYIGIGHGYYVNTSRSVAGVGTASNEGWKWTPANEAAPRIAKAIAILKNEQVAAFVQLPARIE